MGDAAKYVGRYELLGNIGRGGMGHVYRARLRGARGFAKEVAIKRILHHVQAASESLAYFEREAKLTAQLSHPNIGQVLDFIFQDGSLYLVMEYITGWNLMDVITHCGENKIGLPAAVALHVVRDVALALDYAYTAPHPETKEPLRIIHRDVTPHNILVTSQGVAKLIDFGIAKRVEDRPETEGVIGKVTYLSPEQVTGQPLDSRTDVYSLSMVLAECLMGRPIWSGGSISETLRNIEHGNLPNLDVELAAVDAGVRDLVKRGLATNREKRFASMADMAHALQDSLAHLAPRHSVKDVVAFLQQVPIKEPTPSRLATESGGTLELIDGLNALGTAELLGKEKRVGGPSGTFSPLNRPPDEPSAKRSRTPLYLAFLLLLSLLGSLGLPEVRSRLAGLWAQWTTPVPPPRAVAALPSRAVEGNPPTRERLLIAPESAFADWLAQMKRAKVDRRTMATQLVNEGLTNLKSNRASFSLECFRKARLLDEDYLAAWVEEIRLLTEHRELTESRRVAKVLLSSKPHLKTLPTLAPYVR